MDRPTYAGTVTALLVAIFTSIVVIFYVAWKLSRREIEKLAASLPGPPTVPLFGNAFEFTMNPREFFNKAMEWADQYKGIFRIWLGNELVVVVQDPQNMQIVMSSSKSLDKGRFYRFIKRAVGEGILTAPVEKWKKKRRLINPVFNSEHMVQFMPIFHAKNKLFLKHLGREVGKGEFNIHDYVDPMNLDSICKTAMGVDSGAQENPQNEYSKALERCSELAFERMYKFWFHTDFMYDIFGPKEEVERNLKIVMTFITGVIQKKKKDFDDNKIRKRKGKEVESKNGKGTFLDMLFELNNNGEVLSEQDIIDEVVTMLVGGSETSAITISFCILMMAIHQDIQERVYQEVMTVLGDNDEPTMEDMNKLPYLEMVIKETMRRFSMGPLILRQTSDTLKLTTCTVPKGCTIALAIYMMHMNEEYYPEPEKFDPERFSPENCAKRHLFQYVPFSGGPRGCIGNKYAMLSMKVTVAAIIKEYHFETTQQMKDIKVTIDRLLRSATGYPVKINRRVK